MIRTLDILFSLIGILAISPIMFVILVLGFIDTGSPVFKQRRMGKNKVAFTLLKFRTMSVNTESIASHLADSNSVTPLGRFLRKTKLDELPQLFNVLCGDMSLVGPRPNLENQSELIKARQSFNVYDVRPGITGLSQIRRIDMSSPILLAQTDHQMIKTYSLLCYFKYIVFTLIGSGRGDAIRER